MKNIYINLNCYIFNKTGIQGPAASLPWGVLFFLTVWSIQFI